MKHFFSTEWAKLREMSFREKRQYIWEYYKLHFLFIGIFGYVFWGLLNVWVINPNPQNYFYIAWLGPPIQMEYLENLSHSLEEIVENPNRQIVQVTSYSASPLPEENMAIQVRFIAMLQLQELDMFLTQRGGVSEIAAEGFIRPIHGFMDYLADAGSPLYETLSERLLDVTFSHWDDDNLSDITDTMAFSLAESPLLASVGIDTSDLYASIVVNSERYREMAQALEVFFR